MRCWGLNYKGRLGQGHSSDVRVANTSLPVTELGEGMIVRRVVAGVEHACAILQDETLKCWGTGTNGEPEPQAYSGSREWRTLVGLVQVKFDQTRRSQAFDLATANCILSFFQWPFGPSVPKQ